MRGHAVSSSQQEPSPDRLSRGQCVRGRAVSGSAPARQEVTHAYHGHWGPSPPASGRPLPHSVEWEGLGWVYQHLLPARYFLSHGTPQ